jgi:hypothetical protein
MGVRMEHLHQGGRRRMWLAPPLEFGPRHPDELIAHHHQADGAELIGHIEPGSGGAAYVNPVSEVDNLPGQDSDAMADDADPTGALLAFWAAHVQPPMIRLRLWEPEAMHGRSRTMAAPRTG